MKPLINQNYIEVPQYKWRLVQNTPLYLHIPGENRYILYTDGKIALDTKLDLDNYPVKLYVHKNDRTSMLETIHKQFSKDLLCAIKSGNAEDVKNKLFLLAVDTIFIKHPDNKILDRSYNTVKNIVNLIDHTTLRMLMSITKKDYSTIEHSLDCCMLAANYGIYAGWSIDKITLFSVPMFLHDIGKINIPDKILKSNERLSDGQFEIMKNHTSMGKQILMDQDFDPEIRDVAIDIAYSHHEKEDGSGYHGIKGISEFSKAAAIIDCYDALTSDSRPYRMSVDPATALGIIKQDVLKGLYDKETFSSFVASLY